MKYEGVVTLTINGKEYVNHNAGMPHMFDIILNYLLYGNYRNGRRFDSKGFLNYFDIGYDNDGTFQPITLEDAKIRTQASRIEGSSVILQGEVLGSNLVVPQASFADKQFYIRVKDEENGEPLAQVEMTGDMLYYFQHELESTVQILLQWKLSFDN